MDKNIFRKKCIQIRKEIQDKDIKSKIIVDKVLNHPKYKEASVIACYCALKDEVNLDGVIFNALSKGMIVLVPKVDGNQMHFYEIKNMNDLEIQSFGIREPKHDLIFDKNKIDLFLVPGVSFDVNGNRMGFGKGYYDRYLSNLDVYKIGICFEEQISESIPTDKYDVKMNEIIVG